MHNENEDEDPRSVMLSVVKELGESLISGGILKVSEAREAVVMLSQGKACTIVDMTYNQLIKMFAFLLRHESEQEHKNAQ